MVENDYEFSCPYCGTEISVRLDVAGGSKQVFVYDCEVCCRPMHITVAFAGDAVLDFNAEVE